MESRKYPKQAEKYEALEFDFRKFMSDPYKLGLFNDPSGMNVLLKGITSSPQKYDRDEIRELIKTPVSNEKALKDFAQYLYNTNMFFKRLVHYFATMLDFRFILKPRNPENTNTFKKAYKEINEWFYKFKTSYELGKVMKTVILEDVGFYYVRETKDSIVLQRLPTDYCKISGQTNLGYTFAFNIVYFSQTGISVKDYPEELQRKYEEYMRGEYKGYSHYVQLDPSKSVVFKWDENFAGILPILLGTYLTALDIVEYQDLQLTRTQLDTVKLLLQKIPMRNDKDARKNDFLLDETVAGAFHTNIKNALPSGTSVITTPMEVDAINFDNVQNRENIVSEGEQAFWGSAGVSPLLFGATSKSSVGIMQGIKLDSALVTSMYGQFERFINNQINKISNKYKFEVDFLNSTIFNKEEQYNQAIQGATLGLPVSLVAHGLGLQPNDLSTLSDMEEILGIKSKLKPLESTHTSSDSGDNNGGRPEKKTEDLSDTGLQTRDEEQNVRANN